MRKSLSVLFSAVILLASSGCITSDNPKVASSISQCPPDGPDSFYIPSASLDAFRRGWYSEHLSAMGEPSLSCGAPTVVESYRFLWLRTFHQPIAIRITHTGKQYQLDGVVLNGAGGYAPGRVLRRTRRTLSLTQWEQAISALEAIEFWTMPTANNEILALDGAQWIIEGRSDHYHMVDRWGGADGLQRVGLIFLNLSGISIGADSIY
jgi:hypothetical protein